MLDLELRSATIQALKDILNHLHPAGGIDVSADGDAARDGASEASAPSAAGDGAGEASAPSVAGDGEGEAFAPSVAGDGEGEGVSVASAAGDEAGAASEDASAADGTGALGDAVPAASLEEYGAGGGKVGNGDGLEGEAAAEPSGSVEAVVASADDGGSAAVMDAGEHVAQQLAGCRPSATASSAVDLMETLPLVPPGLEAEAWPPRPWIPKSSLRRWLPTKSKDWGKMFLTCCVGAHHASRLILLHTGQESTGIELEAGN